MGERVGAVSGFNITGSSHLSERIVVKCVKQGGTCSQRDASCFAFLQFECISDLNCLPLGSCKLCLTSGDDELVIHQTRQLIMQLLKSQDITEDF